MFYVSKITPFMFLFAIFNLFLSLIVRITDNISLFYTLLVFGFIGITLTGAMYQIIPNSQNRKLSYPIVSYIVFALILVSYISFYTGSYDVGSFILFLSYLIFGIHLILNVKNFMPVTVKFLTASLIYLVLSTLFLFLHYKGIFPLRIPVHTLTVGAMLNAVYGVELAWIPMLIMQTLNVKKAEKLFYVKQGVSLFFLINLFVGNYYFIAVNSLFEIAVALYFLYLIHELFKQRTMPTPLPNVVKIFLIALILLPFGLIAGLFTASHPQGINYLIRLHVDLLVYGFTAFTIFGGMFHLTPRIIWNWKAQAQEKPSFTVSDLLEDKNLSTFIEYGTILYLSFLALDLLFSPLNYLSVIPYAVLMGLFLKFLLPSYKFLLK